MAPRSPARRPARTRTPRTSLNERLLAARTDEPTIGKPKKRAAKKYPAAASKKQKTALPAGQAFEEPTAIQSEGEEPSTNHDLTSSDHDDEDLEDPDAPEELALQPDEEDYDTDDDLYYAF